MQYDKLMLMNRRIAIKACAALTLAALSASRCFADEKEKVAFALNLFNS